MTTTAPLTDKDGAVDPLTYDWKWQFDAIHPNDKVTPFDSAKIYGLAKYASDLEQEIVKLRQQLEG